MYVKVGVTETFDGPPFECALFVCIMVGYWSTYIVDQW